MRGVKKPTRGANNPVRGASNPVRGASNPGWGASNPVWGAYSPNLPNNRRRDKQRIIDNNMIESYSFYGENSGYFMPQNAGPPYQSNQQRYFHRPPPAASSTSPNQAYTSSSGSHATQKLYLCPSCKEPYDFYYSNYVCKGKVPLNLHCQHTLCQECINKKLVKGCIVCPICNVQCELPKSNETIQEIFTPNYYLIGYIWNYKSCHKGGRTVNNIDSIGLVSAQGQKKPIVKLGQQSEEKCCFVSCDKNAVMHCPECNDIYCAECCTVVHKSAKSLMFHKPLLINRSSFSVDLEKCPEHPKMFVEFFCETCDNNACCYCMLEKHQGHNMVYLWKLEPEEMAECEVLKKDAEKIFKQLLVTQKKVTNLINYSTTTTESQIRDFFAFCHAVLAKSEKNLLDELATITTENPGLAAINSSLTKSVNTVKNILSTDLDSEKKINRKELLKKLRELKGMARFLLNENGQTALEPVRFVSACETGLSKVDLQFYIEQSEDSEFILATEDQLPLNYEPDSNLDDPDVEASVIALLKKASKKAAKASAKSDVAEGSVKNVQFSKSSAGSDISEAARKSSRLRPVPAATNDIERIVVTHIKSMDSFYIQYKKMQNKLFQLSREIEDYVKMGGQAVKSPQINELYLARYNAKSEQMWCRGRISEIINGETEPLYEVFFIDYGHTQTVNVDRLKEIPPFLCQKKPFAVECQLYNPTNVSWSKNAHISLGKFISGKDVGMWVKSSHSGVLVVDLMVSTSSGNSNTSVLDFLIYADNVLMPKDDQSRSSSPGSKIEKPSCAPRVIIHAVGKEFEKNQKENVIIVNVEDPYCVYVHIESYRELFHKMTTAMKKAYKTANSEPVVPVEGTFVVVEDKHSLRGRWHRALVKSVDYNLDKIYALLVDWGVSVTVPMKNVRKLNSNFVKLDTQALRVKMADIAPFDKSISWSASSMQYLEAYMNSQEVLKMVVTATEPNLEVLFFDNRGNNNICLNAQMVEQNLADSVGPTSKTVVWPHYGIKAPVYTEDDGFVATLLKKVDDESSSESDTDDVDSPGLTKRQVEIIKVIDPDTIVVKFNDYKDKEADLHKYLQICYNESKKTKDAAWKVDQMCVIAYEDRYVRAKITEILDSETYKLYLPDIVEETIAKHDEIYVYNDMFTKYRQIAVKCQLANIRPAGDTGKWVSSAIEALQQLFNKYRLIYVTKADDNDKKAHFPVNMWYTKVKPGGALEPDRKKYVSVNNALVKLGFAYKKPSQKQPEKVEPKKSKVSPKKRPVTEVDTAKKIEQPTEKLPVKDEITPEKEVTAPQDEASKDVEVTSKPAESKKVDTESEDEPVEVKAPKKIEEDKDSIQELRVPEDWNELIEEEISLEEDDGASKDDKASPYHKNRTEISEWLPPFRIEKREFDAWITCVETGGYLFLHDDCLEKVYRMLEDNLKDYFVENIPEQREPVDWKPGYLCTIHYNDLWYRGIVLDVIRPTEIKVFMIDYGSDHIVPPESLYREILHPDVHAFATKVKLDGVHPKSGKWLSSDYDKLLELVPEFARIVVKGPVEVEVPLVDVYDEDNVLINQKLCDICPNLIRHAMVSSRNFVDDDSVIIEKEEIIPAQMCLNLYKEFELHPTYTTSLTFTEPRLPENFVEQRTLMSIINVLAYDKVLLKSTVKKDMSEEMYNMTIDIQESVFDLPAVPDLKVGTPCVAPWSFDKVWYRAVIHNLDDITSNYVTVLFVDYGNLEKVQKKNVRMLKEYWFEVPVECYTAKLNIELAKEESLPEVMETMETLNEKNRFVQVLSQDPLTVDLYDNVGDLCYKSLISDGLLKRIQDGSETSS